MGNPRVPLEFNTCYHIYNYSVGSDKLFRERRNYFFFLDKLQKWISPVAEIMEWTLAPDHFRLCVRIRSRNKIAILFSSELSDKNNRLLTSANRSQFLKGKIILQFGICFNSYAQGYNKTYKRKGALFRESFYRQPLTTLAELQDTVELIRTNAVRCGLVSRPEEWNFCSFYDSFSLLPDLTLSVPFTHINKKIPKLSGSKLLSELITPDPYPTHAGLSPAQLRYSRSP